MAHTPSQERGNRLRESVFREPGNTESTSVLSTMAAMEDVDASAPTTTTTTTTPHDLYRVERTYHTYSPYGSRRFLVREQWLYDDALHRVGGPAFREWEVHDGRRRLVFEEWYEHGVCHRVGGPASREWTYADGARHLISEEWLYQGKYHREGGAAGRGWDYEDGQRHLYNELWQRHGEHHRIGGAASRVWSGPGQPLMEAWYEDGVFHRTGGPADIHYNRVGGVLIACGDWYYRGRRHRPGLQPATANGRYWKHGVEYTREELVTAARQRVSVLRALLVVRARRHDAAEDTLERAGCRVFEGLMDMLQEY